MVLIARCSSASITILVEAVDVLMASTRADRIVAEVRRTVEEASSMRIATAIEGKPEEVAKLSSTVASRVTSEATLQAAVGIVGVQFLSGKAEVQGSYHHRHLGFCLGQEVHRV